MRVCKERAACAAGSKKLERVFHRVVHIFFIDNSKYFRCIVELHREQKLFRNASQRIQYLQFVHRPTQLDNESVIRFRES